MTGTPPPNPPLRGESLERFILDWYAEGATISEIAMLVPSMPEAAIATLCLGNGWEGKRGVFGPRKIEHST